MTAVAKICGINSEAAMSAAADGGAAFVGLVFFPPSPRHLALDVAQNLSGLAKSMSKGRLKTVGLFVDPDDAVLTSAIDAAGLEIIQLHGTETPDRVADIRARFGRPVMKAIGVKGPEDLVRAEAYFDCTDYLLFDGLGDPDSPIPGGNAATFDWRLLAGTTWPKPWLLAGGLTPDNVGKAIQETGAEMVDVSSGVEAERGHKDPAKIAAFLSAVAAA